MKFLNPRHVPALVLVGALAILAVSCGGGGDTPAATFSASGTAAGTASAVATTASTAAPAPTSTPTAKPKSAADDALAAAVAKYNALVPDSTGKCPKDNPKQQSCVTALSGGSPDRGIAIFGVASADGIAGFRAIFGRSPAGAWDLWLGTQNTSYHVFQLPAAMLVCADGVGVNVRTAPNTDAAIVTLLNDLTKVQAEEFALTAPQGPPNAQGVPAPVGTGWYRISSPLEGWVHSSFLSDAELKDCTLRNNFAKTGN